VQFASSFRPAPRGLATQRPRAPAPRKRPNSVLRAACRSCAGAADRRLTRLSPWSSCPWTIPVRKAPTGHDATAHAALRLATPVPCDQQLSSMLATSEVRHDATVNLLLPTMLP